MATNPEDIVAQAHAQFNQLMEFSRSSDTKTNLHDLEAAVFTKILEIGRLAIEASFAVQALHFNRMPAHEPGKALLHPHSQHPHSQREARLQTICGTVHFSRSYFWNGGQGHYEMDAALNIPPTGPSDFVRILLERLAVSMSYEEASRLLADYFPVAQSTRCTRDVIDADSQCAQHYYQQAAAPAVCPQETILVVQADCKGVPVIAESTSTKKCAPGKKKEGPKAEGKKKMSTLTTVATYAPLMRTAEQIVASLFDDKTYVPSPQGHSFKRVWATMKGKDAAISQSQVFVNQLTTDPAISQRLQHRVLLTDGEKALKQRLKAAYPGYVHVLDLIHGMSYLWLAAGAWYGSNTQAQTKWVRNATLGLLRGEVWGVLNEIFDWSEANKSASKVALLEKAGWYLYNNMNSMRYDIYLAKGWPIASGMVEGACRHVVKDRCERSGQRWTVSGVEGMLALRCIEENGDWASYHAYRIRHRHTSVYGRQPQASPDANESDVYQFKTEMKWADAA